MGTLIEVANTVFPDEQRRPIRVGVVGMADNGRCLGLLRAAQQKFPHTWGTAGGKVEPGETPAQAATREFREETGRAVESVVPLLDDTQGEIRFFTFLGLCGGEFTPVLDHEHTDFRWAAYDAWPAPPSPGMVAVLNDKEASAVVRREATRLQKSFRR